MYEFKMLTNGYEYRLLNDIECDGKLCTAEFEVIRYKHKTCNIDEISRYTEELIVDILENFFKEKYKGYNPNGCLRQLNDNVYSLDLCIEMKVDKYNQLKKFCEGKEIKVLHGELANKTGIYAVKKQGFIIKKITHYAVIENKEYQLKNKQFEFVDGYEQTTYESIVDEW